LDGQPSTGPRPQASDAERFVAARTARLRLPLIHRSLAGGGLLTRRIRPSWPAAAATD